MFKSDTDRKSVLWHLQHIPFPWIKLLLTFISHKKKIKS